MRFIGGWLQRTAGWPGVGWLLLAACVGCAPAGPTTEPDAAGTTVVEPAAHSSGVATAPINSAASEAASQVTLEIADEGQFAALLKSLAGKVVLVDFWATWCVPCRQGFPHTVELHKKYADQGLAVVSVSFDDPDDPANLEDVTGFLRDQQSTFTNYVSKYGAGERSYEVFEVDNGALPHYQLFDRAGKCVRKFLGGSPTGKPTTPEDIEAAVKELLVLSEAVDDPATREGGAPTPVE